MRESDDRLVMEVPNILGKRPCDSAICFLTFIMFHNQYGVDIAQGHN